MTGTLLSIVTTITGAQLIVASIIGGGLTWLASRPKARADRMSAIMDGAWRLKVEAENDAAEAEKRIVVLEEAVRENADELKRQATAHSAEIAALRKLHDAAIEAQQTLHRAEITEKDGMIARLAAKVDMFERKLDELVLAARTQHVPQGTQVESTTTTVTKPLTQEGAP